MEQQRHLPSGSLRQHDVHHQGAASRIRSRLGLGHQSPVTGLVPHRSLPEIQCLANELCAQRGFDIKAQSALPSGGTILSVGDLNFDRALVLLNLFDNARVYSDEAFKTSEHHIRALSLRSVRHMVNASTLESVVRDLANGRVVIMSGRHCNAIQKARALLAPTRRVRVEFAPSNLVNVLIEA